jgi:hypothetical protein
MSRHPNAARLQAWLETGEPNRVGRHVAECERCMASVEELSLFDDSLRADIAEVWAPPSDVEDRTAQQLQRRLRNEEALLTFVDLFAVGWDAVRLVFHPEEEYDRRTDADADAEAEADAETEAESTARPQDRGARADGSER